MTCKTIYEEMMSLKLDGLLEADEARQLEAHVDQCAECSPVWAALQEADSLLCASAGAPAPVPATLHMRVMSQVAITPVFRPQMTPVAAPTAPLPAQATKPLGSIFADVPTGYTTALRRRIGTYLTGVAATGLLLVGTLGLALVLVLSGVISLGEPFAPTVQVLRTFFNTAGVWVRSLVVGIGPEVVAGTALVSSLLLLVGWQVVTSYQRSALERPGQTAYLEALS